ncbi:Alginate lyase domain containing protein [Amanita muscaria]
MSRSTSWGQQGCHIGTDFLPLVHGVIKRLEEERARRQSWENGCLPVPSPLRAYWNRGGCWRVILVVSGISDSVFKFYNWPDPWPTTNSSSFSGAGLSVTLQLGWGTPVTRRKITYHISYRRPSRTDLPLKYIVGHAIMLSGCHGTAFWSTLFLTFIVLSLLVPPPVTAFFSLANDFVDPSYILSGKYKNQTQVAQQTLIAWANELNVQAPWSVTNKTYVAPSGDKHDYMSWSPYWWPDCSRVGNTTNLSDGIFYNAMAWGLQSDRGSTVYSRSAVNFINTWFLNPDTKMNPNLDYAQIIRGPHQWQGSQYGLIKCSKSGDSDLKCFPKIASAILILRDGKAPDWTPNIDTGMASWAKEYINWLQTSAQGINESRSTNNHGTFYENQLAALKLISGDVTGANQNARAYFSNQYLNQISANGKQPLELARTRPYHYSAFNIAGMITNGRIAAYTGNSSVWNLPSLSGATIKTAVDYAITMKASATNETSAIDELTPYIAAVASIYGDPNEWVAVRGMGGVESAIENGLVITIVVVVIIIIIGNGYELLQYVEF